MPTAGDLITEISSQLHGWGTTQDRITGLSANILSTDLSLTVTAATGQATGVTPGLIEIDQEQLYVTAVDTTTGICTIPNFGRGMNGTTAANHSSGAKVISRPRFPRFQIMSQMNEIIGGLYPDIFVVKTKTFSNLLWPTNTYDIADVNALAIMDVQYQDTLGDWQRLGSWSIDPYDQKMRLGSGGIIGRPLRVIYNEEPTQFSVETDNFTITGIPNSAVDLLTLGTISRLMPAVDITRAQNTSVEQSSRSTSVPPNAGLNLMKALREEFQQRLDNEAAALRRKYPPKIVRSY